MKNYVGRKIRGFHFYSKEVVWHKEMTKYIGKVGLVTYQDSVCIRVKFKDDYFNYPISLIELGGLIEECTCENTDDNTCNYCEELQDKAILQDAKSKMQSPEIPQLGEGVFMQVSDGGVNWYPRKVVGQLQNGDFVTASVTWKHARPIPQLPKYTHAELVEKLGEDFEYINK